MDLREYYKDLKIITYTTLLNQLVEAITLAYNEIKEKGIQHEKSDITLQRVSFILQKALSTYRKFQGSKVKGRKVLFHSNNNNR